MRETLICILFLMSVKTFGQSVTDPIDEDHLEPSEGYFAIFEHERDYYPFIHKHLLKGLADRPVARLLTLPSFTPENVVSIERIDKEGFKHKVVYKECSESIWYKKNRNAIEVIRYEAEIDTAIVNLIKKVFYAALLKTRYNEITGIGFDGVTYIFSGTFGCCGSMTGEVWSPRQGTKMNDLVEFADIVIALAKADNDGERSKLKKVLKQKGEILIKRINSE